MSLELSSVESEIEKPVQGAVVFRERNYAVPYVSGRQHPPLLPEAARTSAFVCDCHHRRYVSCEALEAGKQGRKAGTAPYRDYSGSEGKPVFNGIRHYPLAA